MFAGIYKKKCIILQLFNDSIPSFQIFNRDEPDREKLVHVTVKASDKGRPQLEDICTLKVLIKDVNDNSPVFDRASYNVPIAAVRKIRKLYFLLILKL